MADAHRAAGQYAEYKALDGGQASTSGSSDATVNYAISQNSIGWKLLKKAGWEENQGLGVQQQGRKEPVPAFIQKGNQGLGFGPSGPQVGGGPPQAGSAPSGQKGGQPPQGKSTNARMAEVAKAELAKEPVDVKVKRHQQVARQEKADARGRAIQQYLFNAFNDHDAVVAAPPLSHSSRLSATNPLLD